MKKQNLGWLLGMIFLASAVLSILSISFILAEEYYDMIKIPKVTYDKFGREIFHDFVDEDQDTKFTYWTQDSNITLQSMIVGNGIEMFFYDREGRLLKEIYRDYPEANKYYYYSGPKDREKMRVECYQDVINTIIYDELGRVVVDMTTIAGKTSVETWKYSPDGNVVTEISPTKKIIWIYDPKGRMINKTTYYLEKGKIVSEETEWKLYSYDDSDNLIRSLDNEYLEKNYLYAQEKYPCSEIVCSVPCSDPITQECADETCLEYTTLETQCEYSLMNSRNQFGLSVGMGVAEEDCDATGNNCEEKQVNCANIEDCIVSTEEYDDEGYYTEDDYYIYNYDGEGYLIRKLVKNTGEYVNYFYDRLGRVNKAVFYENAGISTEEYIYDAFERVVATKLTTQNWPTDNSPSCGYASEEPENVASGDPTEVTSENIVPVAPSTTGNIISTISGFFIKKFGITGKAIDTSSGEWHINLGLSSGSSEFYSGAELDSLIKKENLALELLPAVEESERFNAEIKTCVDFDTSDFGGNPSLEAGYVFHKGRYYFDSCLNEKTLEENYCGYSFLFIGKEPKTETINCKYGCENGRCISAENAIVGEGTENAPFKIYNCQDLQNKLKLGFKMNKSYYSLEADIDCSETKTWNSGAGFEPIGKNVTDRFKAIDFNGKGYAINNLFINRSASKFASATSDVGIVGYLSSGNIYNLKLNNPSVSGYSFVGTLAGHFIAGNISNITIINGYVSGKLNARFSMFGGVVGFNSGTIRNSSFVGQVISNGGVAGLMVGSNSGRVWNSTFSNSTKLGSKVCIGGGTTTGGSVSCKYVSLNLGPSSPVADLPPAPVAPK